MKTDEQNDVMNYPVTSQHGDMAYTVTLYQHTKDVPTLYTTRQIWGIW